MAAFGQGDRSVDDAGAATYLRERDYDLRAQRTYTEAARRAPNRQA